MGSVHLVQCQGLSRLGHSDWVGSVESVGRPSRSSRVRRVTSIGLVGVCGSADMLGSESDLIGELVGRSLC